MGCTAQILPWVRRALISAPRAHHARWCTHSIAVGYQMPTAVRLHKHNCSENPDFKAEGIEAVGVGADCEGASPVRRPCAVPSAPCTASPRRPRRYSACGRSRDWQRTHRTWPGGCCVAMHAICQHCTPAPALRKHHTRGTQATRATGSPALWTLASVPWGVPQAAQAEGC